VDASVVPVVGCQGAGAKALLAHHRATATPAACRRGGVWRRPDWSVVP